MRDANRLRVIDAAMQLATATYRVTSGFPLEERFGLVAQMRRAAVSIGSNIAGGCGRSTDAQFIQFLQIAMGSAFELEFQTRLAASLGLDPNDGLEGLMELTIKTKRMLAKLIISRRR